MCGFVTIITKNKAFPAHILINMRDRMTHRGPDGEGHTMEDTGPALLGMGHRRLSILDLSPMGAQPMEDISKRYVVVFNGEIYNYIELSQDLKAKGYQFKGGSDTEVLLAAYAEWGQQCLEKLNGMFAFSIWDRKEHTLFVARDRFGEKPLYYCNLPEGGIAMASEAKALFGHPDIYPEPNQAVVDDFTLHAKTSYTEEETFFKHIVRLPPAHAMIIDANGKIQKKWRYWLPDYEQKAHKESDSNLIEEYRERLKKSVQMRLRSDVTVGTCLSGGLDSSVISGLVKELHDEGKASLGHSYSARFDEDPTISEGNYIDSMISYKSLDPEFVSPDPENIIKDSSRLHWHQEQPFLSASMYLEWCVVQKAKQTGTTVLLDGQGADEVLAGYQYYITHHQRDQLFRGKWLSLARNTRLFSSRIKEEAKKYEDSKRRINDDVALTFGELSGVLSKEFYYLRKPSEKPKDLDIPGMPKNQRYNALKSILARGVLSDMLPNNLHSADCNGMAHSVETRFPYIDYDLYDWCLKLPNNLLIKDGWQKYILRHSATNIIPKNIQWRVDKVGFAAPQDVWLRGALKDWAHEKLFNGPITDMEAYDKKFLAEQWGIHQSGAEDVSWRLWSWISMNEWLMLFKQGSWKNGQV